MVTCTCDYNFCFQSAIGLTTFNELLIFLPSLFLVVQRMSCQRKENRVKSMSELTVNCFKFLLSQIQTFIITLSNYHFLKYCGSFTYEILEPSRSEWWVRAETDKCKRNGRAVSVLLSKPSEQNFRACTLKLSSDLLMKG